MKKMSLLMGAFAIVSGAMLASGSLGYRPAAMAAAEEAAQTAEVTGVQVRSGGETYSFIVLQSPVYANVAQDTMVSNVLNYNTKGKVKIYTSKDQAEGTYLTSVCGGWWTQNLWSSGGLMLAVDDYGTYNGTTIYKITIEEGCQLPSADATYVTSKEVTYVNSDFGKEDAKNGAYNWTVETPAIPVTKEEISLYDVQMRGATNGWYYYLVLRSDAYQGLGSTNENFSTDLTTFDKIKLFVSEEDATGTSLSSLKVQHVERNYGNWTNGLFINFAEYDSTYGGHQVYKVVVEKGCELLAETSDASNKVFVVDKTYTFVNNDYGNASAKLGANSWYNEGEIDAFVSSYMHMEDENYSGAGTGLCISDGTYKAAKKAMMNLASSSDDGTHSRAIAAFQGKNRFVEAKSRYESWARANGDASPYDASSISLNALGRANNGHAVESVLIFAPVLAASVAFAVVLFKKRKRV